MASGDDDHDDREGETSFELVLRANAGDTNARDLLVDRYHVRLLRWAHGRLPRTARGSHETHDLVQETLLQVIKSLPRFNPRHEGAFQGFVRTILHNKVTDLARRWNLRPSVELDPDLASRDKSPFELTLDQQRRDQYEAALGNLRQEDRDLIIARIEMALPYKEIMVMFDKPSVAAVTMAVSRALVRLAEEIARERRRG